MKVLISGKARRELLRIYSYLDGLNPAVAESMAREFDRKLHNLSRFPFIGRERFNLAPGLRSVLVGIYLVLYVVDADQITIYQVIDGRQDIDAEFRR